MAIGRLFRHLSYQVFAPGALVRSKYNAFRELLKVDEACHRFIADLEEAHYGPARVDWARMAWLSQRLSAAAGKLTELLVAMCPTRCMDLEEYYRKIDFYVRMGLDLPQPDIGPPYVMPLSEAAGRADLAGGKAAHLAEAAGTAQKAGILTLPGFVATTNAFCFFEEANDLRHTLNRWLRRVDLAKPETLQEAAWALQDVVAKARVPDAVAKAIESAAKDICGDRQTLAVRSSASGEDGPTSFAGQYESELDVKPEDALEAFKRVLAGKYSPRALAYRILHGLPDELAPMAVLFQPMLDSSVSGIIYTRDIHEGSEDCLAVYAVAGHGFTLADGLAHAQVSRFTRDDPPRALVRPGPEPVLSPESAQDLARAGMRLEAKFQAPQDVEWGMAGDGTLYLLQSRGLQLERGRAQLDEPGEPDAEVLMEGLESASRGAAAGRIFHVNNESDLVRLPEGAVVIARTLSPYLAQAVDRIAAAVTGSGSRASHFASVAREFGIPVLVCRCNIFEHLAAGETVTVDARANRVYRGRVKQLIGQEPAATRPVQGETWRRMSKLMPNLVKLNLTDPHAEDFAPRGCRSMHDIVRYAHETAVREMFTLVGKGGRGLGAAKKLESGLPLVMYVLDLGGGMVPETQGRDTVSPEDITAAPMQALWRGLATDKAVWSHDMPHMDWEEFDRISSGVFSRESKLLASYGVVSEDYLHLMLRFGYHFSILDSVCGSEPNANYVNFQFRGGGGSFAQRVMRLEMIRNVLSQFGFDIQSKGDLLNASFARGADHETARRLTLLGALMAETRLMDMRLTEQAHIDEAVTQFLKDHGEKGMADDPSQEE